MPGKAHPLERLVKGGSALGAEPDFLELNERVWILSPANPSVGFRCAESRPTKR